MDRDTILDAIATADATGDRQDAERVLAYAIVRPDALAEAWAEAGPARRARLLESALRDAIVEHVKRHCAEVIDEEVSHDMRSGRTMEQAASSLAAHLALLPASWRPAVRAGLDAADAGSYRCTYAAQDLHDIRNAVERTFAQGPPEV